ncbi:alpha-(1,3)-fucosyltransferase fut-5-like [Watersipora subatra]|uniref:alpha-(1,3)-fucosyltransferase fut-5-like n=1 Tax=Watersipora subatra TaxID=2589382 RepID=UPI00355C4290
MGLSRTHSYRFLLVLSLALATWLLYINKNILPSLTSGHHTEYFPFVNLSRPDRLKVVYGATDYWQGQLWKDLMNFTGCPYSNCISANSSTFRDVHKADVVIFALDYIQRFPQLSWQTRQSQHWLIITYESPAYPFNQFKASYNGMFNGSMTYRHDSTIYYPWGKVLPVQHKIPSILNVAQNKTKGAFVYVSNCKSRNYDRLAMIKELRKYIPIDVFGKCLGHDSPCPPLRKGGNPICETQTHQPYRFYLSFENSLCRDYITEKFWDRLWSPSHFVPVAMGGLTLEDYSSVAPLDSFLHVYNFSSVHDLGQHLRSLMENNDAYNKYHQWRRQYEVTTDRNIAACDLCKLANEKPVLPAVDSIADWWNSNGNCRTF